MRFGKPVWWLRLVYRKKRLLLIPFCHAQSTEDVVVEDSLCLSNGGQPEAQRNGDRPTAGRSHATGPRTGLPRGDLIGNPANKMRSQSRVL